MNYESEKTYILLLSHKPANCKERETISENNLICKLMIWEKLLM